MKMKTWLYNPFEYVAGWKALLTGLAGMAAATYVGTLNHTHFDGVLDVHTGMQTKAALHYLESLVSWLFPALLFYIAGRIFSSSAIRAVDVFGTMALARLPLMLTVFVGFIPAMQEMASLEVSSVKEATARLMELLPWLLPAILLLVVAEIWTVTLLYHAYRVSCNVKGQRGVVSFVAVLLLAEIFSKVSIYALYRWMQGA